MIKSLGDYPVVEGGIFPFLKTAEALTEVVSKLFLGVERKRFREFNFRRYTPKGSVAAFSREVVFKLCKNQVEQGNVFDVAVFESVRCASRELGGMTWAISKEGELYWAAVFSISPHTAPSPTSNTPLKMTATGSFSGEEITQNPLSLVTLSTKRAQKPKLRTL